MSADDELKPIGKPHDTDEVMPSRFIRAGELKGINAEEARINGRAPDAQGRVTLVIASADFYMLEGKKGKERRVVLEFEPTAHQRATGERGKLFTLNKINTLCLKAMLGREMQKWVGKRITVFPDTVREAGMMKGDACIRMWGSPHLTSDLDVSIALRKRTPYTLTMHKVGADRPNNNAGRVVPPAEPQEPAPREPGDDS